MAKDSATTYAFQTEVKQLLQLMIHSLYSSPEIFLRELISNASDAADKLRFEAITHPAWLSEDTDLRIRITIDKQSSTLSIEDNGIGMTLDDMVTHLGTIAKSGTSDFLSRISDDQKKDANLIGQFGVGFYAAFMVADQIDVYSRRADVPEQEGAHWSSQGDGEFRVESFQKNTRGTLIKLHLKESCDEFLDLSRLKGLIKKYSDHIQLPIQIKMLSDPIEGDDQTSDSQWDEPVNQATALWTKSKADIKKEEYDSFYKQMTHDFENPLIWSHNKVEGKLEYSSLLYIPARAPWDLFHREAAKGLRLYVQRVFILDQADQFLPMYLRFVRGVVDSNDLSLNVSREILQKDATVDAIRSGLTKRVLDMLTSLSEDDAEKYQKCWDAFGQVIKEGLAEDPSQQTKLGKLLRFNSTHNNDDVQNVSINQYLERAIPEQKSIYYLTGESLNRIRHSPHLEVFKKNGIEVLLLGDRIDEWVMTYWHEHDGKSLVDVSRGEIDFSDLGLKQDDQHQIDPTIYSDFVSRMYSVLNDKVAEVRVSTRLTESPAILALGQDELGLQLRQMMQASGQNIPETKPILEINPSHPLIQRLNIEKNPEHFEQLVCLLFDQSMLAAGRSLDDPALYVRRLNELLITLLPNGSSNI